MIKRILAFFLLFTSVAWGASTNFQRWDSTLSNIESDTTYSSDSSRINGVQPNSIYPSILHNKLAFQTTAFSAAFAQAFVNKGYTVNDGSANVGGNDFNALVAVFANIWTQADQVSAYTLWNGATYSSASTTPNAGIIPVANSSGALNYGFLPVHAQYIVSSGTFTAPATGNYTLMMVGGGAGGRNGGGPNAGGGGGGGGSGQCRTVVLALTSGVGYPVTIGAGGGNAVAGGNSSITVSGITYTSYGGAVGATGTGGAGGAGGVGGAGGFGAGTSAPGGESGDNGSYGGNGGLGVGSTGGVGGAGAASSSGSSGGGGGGGGISCIGGGGGAAGGSGGYSPMFTGGGNGGNASGYGNGGGGGGGGAYGGPGNGGSGQQGAIFISW